MTGNSSCFPDSISNASLHVQTAFKIKVFSHKAHRNVAVKKECSKCRKPLEENSNLLHLEWSQKMPYTQYIIYVIYTDF